MRRTRSKWLSWNGGWRVRAVALALALGATGLMTAIAAAAIGAKHLAGDGGMSALVLAQQIAQGTPPATTASAPATPASAEPGASASPPAAGGDTPAARAAILAEAATLEEQMQQAISHTDKLRLDAYKAKDIIRVNAVSSKLDEMRQIMAVAKPAFDSIREPGQDIFVMRAKLTTIRQGIERMRQAEAEAESSQGDSVDSVTAAGGLNGEGSTNDGKTDPSVPGDPSASPNIVDRPGQASPFR